MKSPSSFGTILLWAGLTLWMGGCAGVATQDGAPSDVPIRERWQGDYPVAQLARLPEGQRRARVGYLGDAATFAAVWRAFKPGEPVPPVDFDRQLVLFVRNVQFYNRTSIGKVTLKDGAVEVLAAETLSALPIEDKAAMALAVIPRAGVRFIQTGAEKIPVASP
jgi:hypothetical protein